GEQPKGDYFDDWNGGDTTGGQLMSPVLRLSNNCVTIPMAHGSATTSLKVRVTDPAASTTLASIPMLGADLGWRYWRIRIQQPVSEVRAIASDFNREWNEWLALGE